MEWCQQRLNEWGIDPNNMPDVENEEKPFFGEYIRLHEACDRHHKSKALPRLGLLKSPVGAFDWKGSSSSIDERP